jgi:hypothetical protein
MKIDELDEFQGLTREMVDHYLTRTGWCNMPDPDIRLLKPQYAHVSLKMGLLVGVEGIASIEGRSVQALLREINPRMRKGLPSKAARIAHPLGLWLALPWQGTWLSVYGRNRVGAQVSIVVSFPLDDAYLPSADDGFGMWHPEGFSFPNQKPKKAHLWSFWPCDEHGNAAAFTLSEKHGDLWSFWPCDEHGNKVRWPTDADGKML